MNRHEDFCCDRNCKMCWLDKEEAPASRINQDIEGALMEEREASAAYDNRKAEELASLEKWQENQKNWEEKVDNYLAGIKEPKRHIKLLAVVKGNNTFLQVWEGDNHVKEFKSGIGANEMAFFFEDMVIPWRDTFEALGFSVTEEVSCE